MSNRNLVVTAVLSSCVLLRPPAAEAAVAEPAAESGGYWSDWRNVAGWSMMGAGAATLGLWIGAWVRFDEVETEFNTDAEVTDFRLRVGPEGDVCDYAATVPDGQRVLDLCNEGKAWAAVWNVSLALWVVLWGTGAGFLIWYAVEPAPDDDDGTATNGLQLAWSPYLTHTGGGVGLSGWF